MRADVFGKDVVVFGSSFFKVSVNKNKPAILLPMLMAATTAQGRRYGNLVKKALSPNKAGYASTGFDRNPPTTGATGSDF